MTQTRRSTAAQDAWEATAAAMDILAAQEDEQRAPHDPSRHYVKAELYFLPSLQLASQELELLMSLEGRPLPHPPNAANDERWVEEVVQELHWISAHPPRWRVAPRCLDCGMEEPVGNGPPRNDGRPRAGELAPTFRAGVGPGHRHQNGCPP